MAQKFQEINPSDARIYINHRDKENPVTFEYPSKKSAFKICYSFFHP